MSRILLLVVALVAGGLAAFLATRGGGPTVQTPPDTTVIQEERVQVLVATAPIGVGERLSTSNMAWLDWPAGAVREDYVDSRSMPDALSDMQGAVARFEIFEGDPIRQQKLIRTDQGYMSAVLEKGMRGVSIAVTADSASGGFIVPNDHVDVILTPNDEGPSETLVSNVRVLAINTRLGELGATGAPANPNDPRAEVFVDNAIATLELDPVQAEMVANGARMGTLSLSLRSIVDFEPAPGDEQRRSGPIKVIRYGKEATVTAGAVRADVAPTVDQAAFTPLPEPASAAVTPEPEPAAAAPAEASE
jgi:pilus assembly protein CpaB